MKQSHLPFYHGKPIWSSKQLVTILCQLHSIYLSCHPFFSFQLFDSILSQINLSPTLKIRLLDFYLNIKSYSYRILEFVSF